MRDTRDCPLEFHVYHCCLNPMCPSYPTTPRGVHRTFQRNPTCTSVAAILHVRPILLSDAGHMGLSNGIPCVTVSQCCLNPFCPLHPNVPCGTDGTLQWNPTCTCTSVAWIPCVYPVLLSDDGHMGLSNGIPRVPVLLEPTCPSYPTVPSGTDGTAQWNPMCTSVASIPCVSPVLSNGISCVTVLLESHLSILSYCPMYM